MSPTDYIIDLLLIGLVLRQIRRRPLTTGSIVLPFVLIAVAGLNYLRPFRIGGNDLALIVLLTAVGTTLGALSGLTTRVWREDGAIMSQAGAAAALLWILGMAARFGFAYYSTHSGGAEVARFSFSHDITSTAAWTTALVLMAFGEVLARVLVLQARRIRQFVESGSTPRPRSDTFSDQAREQEMAR